MRVTFGQSNSILHRGALGSRMIDEHPVAVAKGREVISGRGLGKGRTSASEVTGTSYYSYFGTWPLFFD